MELYERKLYTMPCGWLFNSYIREYDISKANINILLYKGIISKEEYHKLCMLSRNYRQIQIGYILKDERINKLFEEGLQEARKLFITSNNLDEQDILSIKNDAIFVINKNPTYTSFDNIRFLLKNTYTSFMKIFNLEIYYGLNKQDNSEVLDIKGINDSKLDIHRNYMIDIICNALYFINIGDQKSSLEYIQDIYNKYVSKQLPIEYYRSFDNMSMYTIVINGRRYGVYHLSNTKDNYDILDISYNANLLREIYSYILNYTLGGN